MFYSAIQLYLFLLLLLNVVLFNVPYYYGYYSFRIGFYTDCLYNYLYTFAMTK